MKKTITTAILITGLSVAFMQPSFGQQTPGKPVEKYRIKVVENKNGKESVTDKTFNTRAEMATFIRENNLDMPEPPAAPVAPPAPPLPPLPPVAELKEKKCHQIITIDTEGPNKPEGAEIDEALNELPAAERAEIEQEIENARGEELKVVIIKKGPAGKQLKKEIKTIVINGDGKTANKGQRKVIIEEDASANISNLKVFPNPANGQFNIAFTAAKPTDLKIRISDVSGKEVFSESVKDFTGKYEKSISRSDIPAGTYNITVESGDQQEIRRIVVQ
jgi:hypothetical protein